MTEQTIPDFAAMEDGGRWRVEERGPFLIGFPDGSGKKVRSKCELFGILVKVDVDVLRRVTVSAPSQGLADVWSHRDGESVFRDFNKLVDPVTGRVPATRKERNDLKRRLFRSCLKKIRYDTEAVAQEAVDQLRAAEPDDATLGVYPCSFDNHWHIGHRKNQHQEVT